MRVEFYKGGEGRLCGWVATPPKRRAFQGTTMAAGKSVPHDLTQFVIERALGIRDGFWGLVSHGAWFASIPGLRPTIPGRTLARVHHDALARVEGIVNSHFTAWRRGDATPMRAVLDDAFARWIALTEDERLVMEWPMLPLDLSAVDAHHAHKPQPRKRRARPTRT